MADQSSFARSPVPLAHRSSSYPQRPQATIVAGMTEAQMNGVSGAMMDLLRDSWAGLHVDNQLALYKEWWRQVGGTGRMWGNMEGW